MSLAKEAAREQGRGSFIENQRVTDENWRARDKARSDARSADNKKMSETMRKPLFRRSSRPADLDPKEHVVPTGGNYIFGRFKSPFAKKPDPAPEKKFTKEDINKAVKQVSPQESSTQYFNRQAVARYRNR